MFSLQFVEGDRWRQLAENTSLQYRTIKATRGNIYSDNGSLLATSVPYYRVCLDPTIADDQVFRQGIDSLAIQLSRFYGDRSPAEYRQKITNARQSRRQYLILNRMLIGYQDKKIIENWPIFREGRYRGGILFEKVDKRLKPFSNLANRTVGYINEDEYGAGLEYSFNQQLKGRDGEALFQKVAGGNWKQVFSDSDARPLEGSDIETTIDVNLQDVAESALLRHLQHHSADRGCVLVMEVATGYIKAISNLSRNSAGYYSETYNYAVGSNGLQDPGSTFKLATMIALLEDSNLKPTDTVDTGDGTHKFYKATVRDHKPGGYGKITVQEAFENSSNIAMAKLTDEHFGLQRERFMHYIRNMGLVEPLGFQLKGEGIPKFPSVNSWSGITLPWMAYGYGIEITPLQTLTLYNAVANGGTLMQPILVSAVKKADKTVDDFKPVVLNSRICSPETLASVQSMLEGVVERGTAKNIRDSDYKIAGKTGTAQILENGRYIKKYYTSFAGYFPADRPKYSAIVVIDNPKGYSQYGSDVAAPVFKEIADKAYARDLNMHHPFVAAPEVQLEVFPLIQAGYQQELAEICRVLNIDQHEELPEEWVQASIDSNQIVWKPKKIQMESVPDVRGMTLRDALYLLENKGLRVQYGGVGNGRVNTQSQLPGSRALKGTIIKLDLG